MTRSTLEEMSTTLTSQTSGDQFGFSVAFVGDHNADGLDDILVDRILTAGRDDVDVWPGLEPIEPDVMTPEDVVLARFGRSRGLRLVAEDTCATGQC